MAPRIIWLVLVIFHNYYYRSFLVLVLVISYVGIGHIIVLFTVRERDPAGTDAGGSGPG